MGWFRAGALLLAALLAAAPGAGQETEAGLLALVPPDSITRHVLPRAEGPLPYAATAGALDLYGATGSLRGKLFYTAYVATDAPPGRPLTFVFNGGPGAASAYLHLGLVGPQVVEIGPGRDDGTTPELVANPDSWLAFTDLVLIDPVGSGWSRAVTEGAARDFWGVRQDAESLARFIARYVEVNGRLSAPKYLLGESYGGFRAAKVATALRDRQGILVAGIVMVSPMIDAGFLSGSDADPLTAALQLPSLAAAEMERQGRFEVGAMAEVERFAMTDYLVSLAGPPPEGADRAIFGRIAKLTGVPEGMVAEARGFVGGLHEKHGAGEGRVASPYDAGQPTADAHPEATGAWQEDAVLDGYTRSYGPAFTAYARAELGAETAMTYVLLNGEANRRWDWGEGGRAAASATGDLRDLLAVTPSFRLAVLHGYSDTLTPYGVSRYILDHLPPALSRGRTGLFLYRGGHMFYTDPASRAAAARDMRGFYDAAAGEAGLPAAAGD